MLRDGLERVARFLVGGLVSRLVIEGHQGPDLPNGVFFDERINSTAKWVLGYLLRRPQGWKVWRKDIEARCTEGKGALSTALRQLRAAGYLETSQDNSGGGFGAGQWVVRVPPDHHGTVEKSVDKQVRNPDSGNPRSGNPDSGNPDRAGAQEPCGSSRDPGNPDPGSHSIDTTGIYTSSTSSRDGAPLARGEAARAPSSPIGADDQLPLAGEGLTLELKRAIEAGDTEAFDQACDRIRTEERLRRSGAGG